MSTTLDDAANPKVVPEVHEQESPNEKANQNDDESGETPDKPDDEDHEMEGETSLEPDTAAMSSSSRGEIRTAVDCEITNTTYHIGPTF